MKEKIIKLWIWLTGLTLNKTVNTIVSILVFYVILFWVAHIIYVPFKTLVEWLWLR